MEERQVEVIKKVEGPVIRDRRLVGKPLTITRKRVIRFPRGGLIIVGNPISIIQGIIMSPLFRKKYGTRHRKSVRADIVPMRMCPMEQEPSLQGSTHSAVCVSVVSVERILPGVPIIRIHSIKSLYGNAGQRPIKELKTVRIARQLMRLS